MRGRTAFGTWERTTTVAPCADGDGSTVAATLFARERVEDLELRVAAGEQHDAAIEALGLEFQIATRLTTWIAISEEPTVDPTAPTLMVRMSMPCVVGPYANASATLTLIDSQLRLEPAGGLTPVPPRHSVSIATSSGQNDAGVFEFGFRDERYMPFEGAGATSTWRAKRSRLPAGTFSNSVVTAAHWAASASRPAASS